MNLEGILYAVNRRVAIKVELSPVVLYQVRLAAWKLNQNPSLLLRRPCCCGVGHPCHCWIKLHGGNRTAVDPVLRAGDGR